MNAQGVAVEKRYWRPIMSSLHGMFSLGGMAGAAATGVIAAADLALLPHFLGVGALVAVLGLAACRPMLSAAAEGRRRPRLRAPVARDPPDRGGGARQPGFRGAIADWSAVYLSAGLGAGTTMAAAAFAAFSLAVAAGRFSGDRLVARLGGDLVVRAGGALAAAGLGLTLLIGHPLVAVLGFGLVGAGLSCVFPVVLSSAARTPGLPPSAAIAAVCTVGYFGFLLGPPMIGGLAELIGPERSASWSCSAPDRNPRRPCADRARRRRRFDLSLSPGRVSSLSEWRLSNLLRAFRSSLYTNGPADAGSRVSIVAIKGLGTEGLSSPASRHR